ncbi:MAG: mechanosensitive ion channel family protein [Maribacter sp.]|nr:mechanosensitive ion channel family protein [Maribacter sp.]
MNNQSVIDNLLIQSQEWLSGIISILPNLVLAIVIATASYIISRYVKKYLLKLIVNITDNRTIAKTFANIGTVVFLMLALFVILGVLNLDKALNSFLATAGVAGLAIGLALQEPLMNIFSGVMLSTREKYNIGDLIESNGYFGIIEDVNLKATSIKLLSGEAVSIPNKLVLQNPITNYSTNLYRRVEISCGISYDDNLKKARSIAIDAIRNNLDYIEDKGIDLFYNEFGGSSINFTLRFWIHKTNQAAFLKAQSEAIIAIKKAFDRDSINIPFPIRTVKLGLNDQKAVAMMKENGVLV